MVTPQHSNRVNFRIVIAVGCVALVPAFIKLLCYPHNIGSDDAYIHLRVAMEFVRGQGWGINPHEPVNVSTGPAFTLLVAAAERFTSHAVGLMQLFSAAAVVLGLVLLYRTVLAETQSVATALGAEIVAAFSLNLWRWNGTVMETTFAFATIAGLLYLLRRGKQQTLRSACALGIVLGFGILLRPEMALFAVLAVAVLILRSQGQQRVGTVLSSGCCALLPIILWIAFAHAQHITALPTTYAAKSSTGVIWINTDFARQFAESIAESILLPSLLVFLVVVSGWKKKHDAGQDFISYILPLGWAAGLFVFYYAKMPGLESPGRYLLPLLPAEVLLLALLWQRFAESDRAWQYKMAAAVLGLHAVFAVGVNQWVIAPVLRRFEGEYGATMRAAAEELATRTAGLENKRVLVEVDIGLLSCAGNGRFEIVDGRGLATPGLQNLDVGPQIMQVHPAFVVQSLSDTTDGYAEQMPRLLERVWERRFLQHGVRTRNPFYYTIIFKTARTGG